MFQCNQVAVLDPIVCWCEFRLGGNCWVWCQGFSGSFIWLESPFLPPFYLLFANVGCGVESHNPMLMPLQESSLNPIYICVDNHKDTSCEQRLLWWTQIIPQDTCKQSQVWWKWCWRSSLLEYQSTVVVLNWVPSTLIRYQILNSTFSHVNTARKCAWEVLLWEEKLKKYILLV